MHKFNENGRAKIFSDRCWAVWVDKSNPGRFEVWNDHRGELMEVFEDPGDARYVATANASNSARFENHCDVCMLEAIKIAKGRV